MAPRQTEATIASKAGKRSAAGRTWQAPRLPLFEIALVLVRLVNHAVNWEAISAIGQMVGALAVVMLSRQIFNHTASCAVKRGGLRSGTSGNPSTRYARF